MKIYVPEFNNGNCLVIQSEGVVRVYESRPTQNSSVNYVDYYVNSHYMSRSGNQQFSQYTSLPSCYDNSLVTTNYYYRFDLAQILIAFFVLVFFCFFFPYRIISRMFGRWLKI